MKKKFTKEEMIHDILHHPIKAYFKYPLGTGWDEIRWSELLDGVLSVFESLFCLSKVIILITWHKLILKGLLRPFYKAYYLVINRKKLKGRNKK